MADLDIHQVPVLRDNYVYLAHDPVTGACAAVDPAVAAPVFDALQAKGWTLTHILNTHHHHDHVGANAEIKQRTGCTVVGHAEDWERIPGIDVHVNDGDTFHLGSQTAHVMDVTGHTRGHIAYWFEDSAAVFCGDTLFSLGCGRLFEGTPAEMWTSLQKLRALPDETKAYCAHEYTESNAKFALTIEPENPALRRRVEEVRRLRAAGAPTVPSSIGVERTTNPFLRADVDALQLAAGLAGSDPVDVFAEIRRRKDVF